MTIQEVMQAAWAAHQAGRWADAEGICGQALAQAPDEPNLLNLLGVMAVQRGQAARAAELIGRAARIVPGAAGFHFNLGVALAANKDLDGAEEAYRRACELSPDDAVAWINLGEARAARRKWAAAVEAYQRGVALLPADAGTHNALGVALQVLGRAEEAAEEYRRVLEINPRDALAMNNLGNALNASGRRQEAVECFRKVIAEQPQLPEAHANLGVALFRLGRVEEARGAYRQALALRPEYTEALNNLGHLLHCQGELDEAIECYDRALAIKPDDAAGASNRLLAMQFHPGYSAAGRLEEHRRWDQRFGTMWAKGAKPHRNARGGDRRIRVGYLSGDFRRHSVTYFLLPLLAEHDRGAVEVFCYDNTQTQDEFTARLRRVGGTWRRIVGVEDQAVAEQVREDGIDILVDLSGHTAGNRLGVMARRAAPVQVTYLGYPSTTGLSAIDYRLTDALADPPGKTESFCSETLVRLATCAWCFAPLEEAPLPLPRRDGPITFGCFNALPKINTGILDIWAELLRRMPEARLLLKAGGLGEAAARGRIGDELTRRGISAERFELMGTVAEERKHLELYGRVDVALDTFPYHGTTTTCEALWMGVPVVTLAGEVHVSRVGVSLLNNVGLAELVAGTPEEYVEIAVKWANDLQRLAEMRLHGRERMQASPLMDAPRFAREVEQAYRRMWRTWCETGEK